MKNIGRLNVLFFMFIFLFGTAAAHFAYAENQCYDCHNLVHTKDNQADIIDGWIVPGGDGNYEITPNGVGQFHIQRIQSSIPEAEESAGGFIAMILAFFNGGAVGGWIAAILAVMGSARMITMLTPNKVDDKIVNAIVQVLNFLSGGVGKNKV